MYDLIAFKDGECVRHVYNDEESIIENLLYKDFVVYRADTRQVAIAILHGSIAWADVITSPMSYKHDSKLAIMRDKERFANA